MNARPNLDESWTARRLYVVGHQRPDTDAIGAAIGYAWLLQAEGQTEAVPARAGQTSDQAAWALRRFEMTAPRLLASAAPTFGHAAEAVGTLPPDAPLEQALPHFREGARAVPVTDGRGAPLGVVTPAGLARCLTGTTSSDGALKGACGSALDQLPTFAASERIADHRGRLLRGEADDFLVVDADGRCLGLTSRARILDPPRARLFLVDHNELSQAVPGAEEADIVGVLDHHRLGNPATALPIPFRVEPVGSTGTLVAEEARAAGLVPPAAVAGMLLSGLLSDTLAFRSPTTTARDRETAVWLAGLAGVELESFGVELLRAGSGLRGRSPDALLEADRKRYTMGGQEVAVAQVEVAGCHELPEAVPELLQALDALRGREGLALACLMVTDIVTGRSRLLCAGERRILAALPFPRFSPAEFDLGEIVSRKKQLVPALQSSIEAAV
jgi:manganese-dependent inorganic pyrophosphatase